MRHLLLYNAFKSQKSVFFFNLTIVETPRGFTKFNNTDYANIGSYEVHMKQTAYKNDLIDSQ